MDSRCHIANCVLEAGRNIIEHYCRALPASEGTLIYFSFAANKPSRHKKENLLNPKKPSLCSQLLHVPVPIVLGISIMSF
jgi:hypothetical protein